MITQEQLAQVIDKDAIRELRARYSLYLDSGEIDRLDEVFAQDAEVTVTVGTMHGIEQIKQGLHQAYRDFDRDNRQWYPFLHPITNHIVTLTGPDSATGTCYLVDFETASKQDPNPLLLLGVYRDHYQRIDGEWRITESLLEVVWPTQQP